MDYKKELFRILEKNMTEKGYKLFSGICKIIPDIWNRPTASTGKYHKKRNGEISTNAEHTYDLVYATTKISRMFNVNMKTPAADKLLIAAALHDSLKYGMLGNRPHTDSKHDKYAADMVSSNKENFEKIMTEEQFFVMEEMIRFHSGQWSTDVINKHKFDFKDYNPETLFLHILDMLSTAACIQTDLE